MQDVGMKRPVVTLGTPVSNEAGNIARYAHTVREELLDRSDIEYRVLFVDDGSQDRSWDMILELCRTDPRFQAIRLSRNFGPHVALSAALHQAEGDAVAVLACDLQDPPEVIRGFVEKWQAGARIVWGKRQSRADSAFRVISSQFFEGLLRRYAMPARSLFATGSFLLMDRRVLDCYRQFQERNRTTFALVAWTGFEQGVVEYHRKARLAGESSWKLHKLIRAAYDTLLAFSRVPFGLVTVLGLLLFGGSIVFDAEDLEHGLLGGAVRVGDQIDPPLVLDAQRPFELLAEHARPSLGRGDAMPEQVVGVVHYFPSAALTSPRRFCFHASSVCPSALGFSEP